MTRIGSQQYTVTTSPILIAVGNANVGGSPGNVRINNSSATAIYLGGAHVTSGNGFLFSKQNDPLVVDIHDGDELWAVTASGSATISVLQT